MTRSAPNDASFEDAFAGLAAVAHRVAYRLLGDRGDAEEVAQEALARAFGRWPAVEPHAEAWVARVAANLALDQHRRRARSRRHAAREAAARRREPDRTDRLVTRLELVEGLRALPRRQREVVVLRYLADASEAATAALLGCSTGTVKQHAHRGLAALRLALPDPRHPVESDVALVPPATHASSASASPSTEETSDVRPPRRF